MKIYYSESVSLAWQTKRRMAEQVSHDPLQYDIVVKVQSGKVGILDEGECGGWKSFILAHRE